MTCPESVSVVICSHLASRWEYALRAVASVEEQAVAVDRIVFGVDGDDVLGRRAMVQLSERCQVVVRPERGGLSEARNSGLGEVKSPLVAFLDDDAEADVNWLGRLVSHMEDPAVLGAGGRSTPLWEGAQPKWFPDELLWVVGCSYRGLPERSEQVRNVFGGCAIYRRSLFDELGGFRSEFGRQHRGAAGCEETEFCLRTSQAHPDGTFIYVPSAVILHNVPLARSTPWYILRRSFDEGRSKARLVRFVPSQPTKTKLNPELYFLRSTAVRGIRSELIRTLRGDLSGLAAAAITVASVAGAACGYLFELVVASR
jgi:glucosyl-dolichyl phosphate glucuronosyltransferase